MARFIASMSRLKGMAVLTALMGEKPGMMMDLEAGWAFITASLGRQPRELQTQDGLWFVAYREDGQIKVDNSARQVPSTSFKGPLTIRKEEFAGIAPFFDDWRQGVRGVRKIIRDKSRKSSYILALMKWYAERQA